MSSTVLHSKHQAEQMQLANGMSHSHRVLFAGDIIFLCGMWRPHLTPTTLQVPQQTRQLECGALNAPTPCASSQVTLCPRQLDLPHALTAFAISTMPEIIMSAVAPSS